MLRRRKRICPKCSSPLARHEVLSHRELREVWYCTGSLCRYQYRGTKPPR